MQTIVAKIPLKTPTRRKAALMEQATALYQQAVSWYIRELADTCPPSKRTLHTLYPQACALFSLARASLQCAGFEALGLLRAYRTNVRKGKATLPSQYNGHLQLRQDSYSIVDAGSFLLVKFPTLAGRKTQVRLPLEPDNYQRAHLDRLLTDERVRKGAAKLIRRKGRWFLYVTLSIKTEEAKPTNVLGVDLGIVNLAVTSDGQFFSGRAVRFRKERLAKLRKTYQEKGRRSRMRKREGKDRRWMTHVNHCLSKAIVEKAKAQNAAIALENLEGIRGRAKLSKRFNRMLSGWAFWELRKFIEYKARLAGVVVVAVDPRSSSQTCSRCGERGKRDRSAFHCEACSLQLHSDLNAARNLCQRGISSLIGELETPLRPTALASG